MRIAHKHKDILNFSVIYLQMYKLYMCCHCDMMQVKSKVNNHFIKITSKYLKPAFQNNQIKINRTTLMTHEQKQLKSKWKIYAQHSEFNNFTDSMVVG